MDDGALERARRNATSIASTLVTAIWLGAMFTGQSWWLAALLVGYVAVVPLVALLFGDEADRREWVDDWTGGSEETDESEATGEVDREGGVGAETGHGTDNRDALETLRERYAAGELTDEQFERKLETLVSTETLEDVEERVRERREGGREREREYER